MESIESIKQRLSDCEENLKELKEKKAPRHLIYNEERMLKLMKANLEHRLKIMKQ